MRIDKRRTMRAFKKRLRSLDKSLFSKWFDGKWISSFDIRSTIMVSKQINARMRKHYSVQAYLIALEKGASPLGITTEHTHNGKYVCVTRQSIDANTIQYIGKYSHFSGHTLRRQDNPFTLQPEDKRYGNPDERPVCLAYNLRRSLSISTT